MNRDVRGWRPLTAAWLGAWQIGGLAAQCGAAPHAISVCSKWAIRQPRRQGTHTAALQHRARPREHYILHSKQKQTLPGPTWLMDALPSGMSRSIHSNTASSGTPSSCSMTSRACSAGMGGTCIACTARGRLGSCSEVARQQQERRRRACSDGNGRRLHVHGWLSLEHRRVVYPQPADCSPKQHGQPNGTARREARGTRHEAHHTWSCSSDSLRQICSGTKSPRAPMNWPVCGRSAGAGSNGTHTQAVCAGTHDWMRGSCAGAAAGQPLAVVAAPPWHQLASATVQQQHPP